MVKVSWSLLLLSVSLAVCSTVEDASKHPTHHGAPPDHLGGPVLKNTTDPYFKGDPTFCARCTMMYFRDDGFCAGYPWSKRSTSHLKPGSPAYIHAEEMHKLHPVNNSHYPLVDINIYAKVGECYTVHPANFGVKFPKRTTLVENPTNGKEPSLYLPLTWEWWSSCDPTGKREATFNVSECLRKNSSTLFAGAEDVESWWLFCSPWNCSRGAIYNFSGAATTIPSLALIFGLLPAVLVAFLV